jgi:hypothetical protein
MNGSKSDSSLDGRSIHDEDVVVKVPMLAALPGSAMNTDSSDEDDLFVQLKQAINPSAKKQHKEGSNHTAPQKVSPRNTPQKKKNIVETNMFWESRCQVNQVPIEQNRVDDIESDVGRTVVKASKTRPEKLAKAASTMTTVSKDNNVSPTKTRSVLAVNGYAATKLQRV